MTKDQLEDKITDKKKEIETLEAAVSTAEDAVADANTELEELQAQLSNGEYEEGELEIEEEEEEEEDDDEEEDDNFGGVK